MISNAPKFRPARAEDVKAIAPLAYSAGPETFEYIFGRKDKRGYDFLLKALGKKGNNFNYETHYVLEENGEIVAVGALQFPEAQLKAMMHTTPLTFKFGGLSALGMGLRGIKAQKVLTPAKKDECLIAHIGVHPDHRRKGYGEILIKNLVDICIEKGKTPILHVDPENVGAMRLYTKMGFTNDVLTKSTLKNEFGFIQDHLKMIYKTK